MYVFERPILVTRPYLPSLEKYQAGLKEVWQNCWLTKNGPILRRFSKRLVETLKVPEEHLSLFVNGTLALEVVYQALGINTSRAEVITTPFTFVATSHALRRVGVTPVFADVDPDTLCITPETVEPLITERTTAIVPVHVYGHPCNVEGFQQLAQKYGLRLIYDAAHAFGVSVGGGYSIAEWGDASMFSFHSTKLFHSIEGGLLVFQKTELKKRLEQLKNFAISSETTCDDVGTNAKMNEMAALMGECCLEVLPELIDHRKAIYETYAEVFEGSAVRLLARPERMYGLSIGHNYAYCPILLKDFATREYVYEELKKANVFTRRYFYPLLSDFAPYVTTRGRTPVARQAADCILTLPSYHTLALDDVRKVAQNVLEIVG